MYETLICVLVLVLEQVWQRHRGGEVGGRPLERSLGGQHLRGGLGPAGRGGTHRR